MHIDLTPVEAVTTTPVGERILEAASRLFRENGITATGVDRIVDEAATTKRTLYQRFGSKDRLVACYLQQRAHEWQTELVGALTECEPSDAIAVIYEHTSRWAAENARGCAFVTAWGEIGASDHEASAFIREEKEWMRSLFTQIARGDARTGSLLHMLYEGAQVTASIRHDLSVFDQAREASDALLRSNRT